MSGAASKLVTAIRTGLAELGDARMAERMRAYLRSTMPFRGASTPARTRLTEALFAEYPLPDQATWRTTVLTLWREAAFREERYVAIGLPAHRTCWRTVSKRRSTTGISSCARASAGRCASTRSPTRAGYATSY
jgi:hypothetical protein